MMPTEHCFENLKIKNNNLQHVASSRSSAMLVPIPNLQPSFCLVWCLWHYHDSMTSRENTWTCNTSRGKCTCPWHVSLSVTAVCAEGAVWWSWGRGKTSLHSFQWTERGQAEHPHLFPCVSHTFPSSLFPLYSMCCLISLQWNIREGCGLRVPGAGSNREEPSVMSSLLDRFLEQECKVSHHPSLHCLLYIRITVLNVSDHPGVLWALGMSPCVKAICAPR